MRAEIRGVNQNGGVLAEAAIAIVFLFGAMVWLLELGRLTRNVVALPQLTYDLSVSGATNHPKLRDKLVEKQFEKVFPVLNRGLKDETVSVVADQANATIAVQVKANLSPLIQDFGLAIGRRMVIAALFEKIVSLPPLMASFGTNTACGCTSGNSCPNSFGLDNCPTYRLNPVSPPGVYHSCFSGDTQIALSHQSSRAIADLKIGDSVLSLDPLTQLESINKVTDKIKRSVPRYYLLNNRLRVSSEHPFWVNDSWKKARNLKIGDVLTGLGNKQQKIFSKRLIQSELTVYNITVANIHTYFAGGVLVHNKNPVFNVYDAGQGCNMYGYDC